VPRRRRAEAEALAKVAPVAAIAQAAPQKHGRDDRSGEIYREEIDESQVSAAAFQAAGGAGVPEDWR